MGQKLRQIYGAANNCKVLAIRSFQSFFFRGHSSVGSNHILNNIPNHNNCNCNHSTVTVWHYYVLR